MKIKEINIEGKTTKKVEYEIYDLLGNKLDLTLCNDIPIKTSSIITNPESVKLEEGKKLSEIGVDIYNKNDEFFNDFCNNKDIGKGTDIIISDRKTDILVDVDFCDEGCEYKGIDFNTNRVNCECFNNNNSRIYSNINNNNKTKRWILEFINNNINYKIVICYSLIMKRDSYKNNYGFLFSFIILIALLICTSLHFSKTIKILKTKIYSYIILPKNHVTILYNNNLKPSPPKNCIKEEEKNNTNIESNIFHEKKNNYSNIQIPKRKKHSTKMMSENISSEERMILKYRPNIKEIIKSKKKNDNEKEYNDMSFYVAIYEDKRTLWTIIYTSFISKIEITRIIFFSNQFDILYITVSSCLFGIIVDFTINALLFSEVILSRKYKSGNNQLNFMTSESLSIISDILGNIFCFYMDNLINFSYALELLKNEAKSNIKLIKVFKRFEKLIRIRLFIYFSLQFLFMLCFIYYLVIFCTLYKYSQKALFKNYLMGLLTHLIYSLFISFIISILRFISLKYNNKRLFLISQFLNNLF